jgi:acyl-CoA reductase-like NAD-dependent aldehyde dehydrogenase
VDRCVSTLLNAADEVTGLVGSEVAVDAVPVGAGRIAFTVHRPIGVVSAICGFNFPVLLAVHKLAAAIGAGCPIVIKPSERTPFTTPALAEITVAAGWPQDAISVLNGFAEVGARLVEHPQVALVSFTGSSAIGAKIAEQAGRHLKKVILELGSNAATVVAQDADLDLAAERCAAGIVASTGQSCISVQRIIAHASVAEELSRRIAGRLDRLTVGPGLSEETDVGGLVSEAEQARVAELVEDALEKGASMATNRPEAPSSAALLLDVPVQARMAQEEAFGPIAGIFRYTTDEEARDLANSTPYGLIAGVFTESLTRAMWFAEHLQAGGVHINDCSNFRPDNIPYGGVKHSGIGREGPAYAMREMSIEKVITLRGPSFGDASQVDTPGSTLSP